MRKGAKGETQNKIIFSVFHHHTSHAPCLFGALLTRKKKHKIIVHVLQDTVNSLYSRHSRDLELMSSLARVLNSGSLFQSNVCNIFFLGFSCCPCYRGVCYSGVSTRRELTVWLCLHKCSLLTSDRKLKSFIKVKSLTLSLSGGLVCSVLNALQCSFEIHGTSISLLSPLHLKKCFRNDFLRGIVPGGGGGILKEFLGRHYHKSSDCFEYPKISRLKLSHPKNSCQIVLPKKNTRIKNKSFEHPSLEIWSTPLG